MTDKHRERAGALWDQVARCGDKGCRVNRSDYDDTTTPYCEVCDAGVANFAAQFAAVESEADQAVRDRIQRLERERDQWRRKCDHNWNEHIKWATRCEDADALNVKLQRVVDAAREFWDHGGSEAAAALSQALRDLDEPSIQPAVDFILDGDKDEKVTAGTPEEIEQSERRLEQTIESIKRGDLDEPREDPIIERIVVCKDEDGKFYAYVEDLPGCVAGADTVPGTLRELAASIETVYEVIEQDKVTEEQMREHADLDEGGLRAVTGYEGDRLKALARDEDHPQPQLCDLEPGEPLGEVIIEQTVLDELLLGKARLEMWERLIDDLVLSGRSLRDYIDILRGEGGR